jgi:hypothetical protein
MGEWHETTLAEIASWSGGLTPSKSNRAYWEGGTLPWLSSKEVTGGVIRDTEHKVTEAALRETSLRRVPANSVAVVVRSGILLHSFPVALVPFDCTVNQDVKVGVPAEVTSGPFLRLLLEFHAPEILDRLRKTGTTVQSIDVPGLLRHPVLLPPLDIQRRIVDVVAAVDMQTEALEAEVNATRTLLEASLTEGMSELPERVKFEALAQARSGPSWSASDEHKESIDGGLRVVKITNTRPDGAMDMSDETYVTGLPGSTPVLDDQSIVLIRTNGNRQRIGNVYRPTRESIGCAVSAFQFLVRATDTDVRDFLYWALRDPAMQRQMSEGAAGSTGLGNLAAKWLKAADIPWSEDAAQRARLVERFRTTAALGDALASELVALRVVRARLLATLLSGDVTIPPSYDDLIQVAP